MPQQRGLQDQTNRTLPVTHGFAELLTFAHLWDFPHLDTRCSNHQEEETLQAEEADYRVEEEDSQVEEADLQEEDSRALGDRYQEIHKEDHQETD